MLFTLAFFVTVALLGWRWFVRQRAHADLERTLGAHEDAVVDVAGFEAIDAAVDRARCAVCSGRFDRVGEGPSGALFAVRVRCKKCGATTTLRFRLPTAIQ